MRWVLGLLLVAGCQAESKCRRALETKFGLGAGQAKQICTSSCEDNLRFGIEEKTCRWLEAGAVGDPPQ
jgi:hypothetical protein